MEQTEMENQNPRVMPTAMKWGAIAGLGQIILTICFYFIKGPSLDQNWMQTVLSLVLIIICLLMAMQEQRALQGGYINFGRAFGTGMLTSLFLGIISGFFSYLFFKYGDPEMINNALEQSADTMRERGTSEEQIEMTLGYTRKFMQPGFMAVMTVFGSALMALLPAIVLGLIVQKKTPSAGF